MAWMAAIAAAVTLLALPVLIALLRDVERPGLVVLATVLTAFTGVAWFGALYLALTLPRKPRPVRVGHVASAWPAPADPGSPGPYALREPAGTAGAPGRW